MTGAGTQAVEFLAVGFAFAAGFLVRGNLDAGLVAPIEILLFVMFLVLVVLLVLLRGNRSPRARPRLVWLRRGRKA
ncbi:MAG TPA: hypothetical protein VEO96_00555 [Thermoplasmata archaeon]|nr:hypothetical protein [Thermoplasmata archaeon]